MNYSFYRWLNIFMAMINISIIAYFPAIALISKLTFAALAGYCIGNAINLYFDERRDRMVQQFCKDISDALDKGMQKKKN